VINFSIKKKRTIQRINCTDLRRTCFRRSRTLAFLSLWCIILAVPCSAGSDARLDAMAGAVGIGGYPGSMMYNTAGLSDIDDLSTTISWSSPQPDVGGLHDISAVIAMPLFQIKKKQAVNAGISYRGLMYSTLYREQYLGGGISFDIAKLIQIDPLSTLAAGIEAGGAFMTFLNDAEYDQIYSTSIERDHGFSLSAGIRAVMLNESLSFGYSVRDILQRSPSVSQLSRKLFPDMRAGAGYHITSIWNMKILLAGDICFGQSVDGRLGAEAGIQDVVFTRFGGGFGTSGYNFLSGGAGVRLPFQGRIVRLDGGLNFYPGVRSGQFIDNVTVSISVLPGSGSPKRRGR